MRWRTFVPAILGGAMLAACSHAAVPGALPPLAGPLSAARPDKGGFKAIYAFKSPPDAELPVAGLVVWNGTLYGTTESGGQASAGAIFSLTPAGKERVVHSFGFSNVDGVFPSSGLVVLGGALYGTTFSGGKNGFGAVYKLAKSGKENLIYSFAGGKDDGANPAAGLVVDGGKLYGTTQVGGSGNCPQGCGTVFEVTTSGRERVVYSFKGGKDGINPVASLLLVGSQLYGTTPDGGKNGEGTIFKTSVSGNESVIYSFKGQDDGGEPAAGLIEAGGTLYGTTNTAGSNFGGVVFSASTSGKVHAIYSFKGVADGQNPEAPLFSYKGKLYGTTTEGGASNIGIVFSVTTSGKENVLHSFANDEGANPRAALVELNKTLYGTAPLGGGSGGFGTVFRITP